MLVQQPQRIWHEGVNNWVFTPIAKTTPKTNTKKRRAQNQMKKNFQTDLTPDLKMDFSLPLEEQLG